MSKENKALRDALATIQKFVDTKVGIEVQSLMKTPMGVHFQDGDFPGILFDERLLTLDHLDNFVTKHSDCLPVEQLPLELTTRKHVDTGYICFMTDRDEADFTNIYSYFLILDDEWHVSWTAQGGVNRTKDTYRRIWNVIL